MFICKLTRFTFIFNILIYMLHIFFSLNGWSNALSTFYFWLKTRKYGNKVMVKHFIENSIRKIVCTKHQSHPYNQYINRICPSHDIKSQTWYIQDVSIENCGELNYIGAWKVKHKHFSSIRIRTARKNHYVSRWTNWSFLIQ